MPAARICLRLLAWLGSTAGISFCSGALAAPFSVVFCHQMFARFGSGLITSAATAAALSIGLLVGAVGSRVGRSRAASAIVALIPAIWVLLSGWFADRMGSVYGSFELSALASPEAQFAAALGTALLLVAVPAACGARLALGNRTLDGAWGCFLRRRRLRDHGLRLGPVVRSAVDRRIGCRRDSGLGGAGGVPPLVNPRRAGR